MIEELHRGEAASSFVGGKLKPFADGALTHWLMCAECHKDIKGPGLSCDLLMESLKQ
ncbi:hypothetical protein SDC9_210447 [bioreactor metagenome]|uniref:Uncharacterized protein n=1 Tax=bioreactor metagenome TaxID=1076179 RepID=A0A645JR91_9ZZZZ